jgi:cystathionine beta-lyase
VLTEPGDGVVINPPVYHPFSLLTRELGRTVVDVPLLRIEEGGRLDLEGLERAFAGGARVYLLCHPHNPTGRTHDREELAAVAALAARHGVTVVSDEIHSPMSMSMSMSMPEAVHVPYLTLGDDAVATGIAVTSASKAWNLAGLKCALIVTGGDAMHDRLTAGLPSHLAAHTGHLGVLASIAAFEDGEEWLDALVAHLDRNRALLGELLARHLPQVRYVPPQAGYLTWLDCRELGLGDDPAEAFLERGRVALSPGPAFGEEGKGFARLNIGTSSALVEDAVRRMAAAV